MHRLPPRGRHYERAFRHIRSHFSEMVLWVKIESIVLEGRFVRLEPLQESHHAALCEVGLDPELWNWIPYRATTADEMRVYIRTALDAQAVGTALPFATVERSTGHLVVSTRYINIDGPTR